MGIKINEPASKPKPASTPLGSTRGGFRMHRSTRYALLPTAVFLFFIDLCQLYRMPKDIKPEIPVADSSKSEGSPKVTNPPESREQ
jgi:hypothetical protein